MATCPECGTKSRDDPGAFVISDALVAQPLGDFSLSGQQMKVSAHRRLKLECQRCHWHVYGYIQGEDFIADPIRPRRGSPNA